MIYQDEWKAKSFSQPLFKIPIDDIIHVEKSKLQSTIRKSNLK